MLSSANIIIIAFVIIVAIKSTTNVNHINPNRIRTPHAIHHEEETLLTRDEGDASGNSSVWNHTENSGCIHQDTGSSPFVSERQLVN